MTATPRSEFIAQLRQLADLLAQHPEIPTPDYPRLHCHIDRDAWDQLDQLADYLTGWGIPFADDEPYGSGQRIVALLGLYEVVSHTQRSMEEFEARTSYDRAVTL